MKNADTNEFLKCIENMEDVKFSYKGVNYICTGRVDQYNRYLVVALDEEPPVTIFESLIEKSAFKVEFFTKMPFLDKKRFVDVEDEVEWIK